MHKELASQYQADLVDKISRQCFDKCYVAGKASIDTGTHTAVLHRRASAPACSLRCLADPVCPWQRRGLARRSALTATWTPSMRCEKHCSLGFADKTRGRLAGYHVE